MANIQVGDIYEDCAYHPVRCTNRAGDHVEGISMVDGSFPRCCSLSHCGVIKLTEVQAKSIVDLWNTKGERGVLMSRGGMSNKEADACIKKRRK